MKVVVPNWIRQSFNNYKRSGQLKIWRHFPQKPLTSFIFIDAISTSHTELLSLTQNSFLCVDTRKTIDWHFQTVVTEFFSREVAKAQEISFHFFPLFTGIYQGVLSFFPNIFRFFSVKNKMIQVGGNIQNEIYNVSCLKYLSPNWEIMVK